jgi:hypothetical protein
MFHSYHLAEIFRVIRHKNIYFSFECRSSNNLDWFRIEIVIWNIFCFENSLDWFLRGEKLYSFPLRDQKKPDVWYSVTAPPKRTGCLRPCHSPTETNRMFETLSQPDSNELDVWDPVTVRPKRTGCLRPCHSPTQTNRMFETLSHSDPNETEIWDPVTARLKWTRCLKPCHSPTQRNRMF